MSARRIYLDNSATTPLDPRVAQAMQPYLGAVFGNPSSLHQEGREAHEGLDRARSQVAALLNADPGEIVFTASGTESDNLAFTGVIEALRAQENHIITSAIEHPAILETCRSLERRGVEVTYLPCDSEGLIDPDELAGALRPSTRLVSIMTANNVVGTVQPIRELARIAHDHGVPFHTDAVQAAGRIPFNVRSQSDRSAYLSPRTKFTGRRESARSSCARAFRSRPSSTAADRNADCVPPPRTWPGIAGLGCAAEIARTEMSGEAARLVKLRERIIDTVAATLPNAYLIGHRHRRLPGHVCLGFAGLEGEAIRLLFSMDEAGIAISSGAPAARITATSRRMSCRRWVLILFARAARCESRLGRFNTEADVEDFLRILPEKINELRPISTYAITTTNKGN